MILVLRERLDLEASWKDEQIAGDEHEKMEGKVEEDDLRDEEAYLQAEHGDDQLDEC